MDTIRILFVCTGNICRSPLAEGLFGKLVEDEGFAHMFEIGSAGTTSFHVGEPPHRGVVHLAQQHGIELDGRARQVTSGEELETYDWIIGMTPEHVDRLRWMNVDAEDRIRLLLEFADGAQHGAGGVHDPYYDGDFQKTYDQVEAGCRGLLQYLRDEHAVESP
ncbi:MAG: low molecular weight protein-tyrosine-phosphatase [Candidatus Bipolaricaulia bacterium]